MTMVPPGSRAPNASFNCERSHHRERSELPRDRAALHGKLFVTATAECISSWCAQRWELWQRTPTRAMSPIENARTSFGVEVQVPVG
jgi:hypothetical protein